MIFTEKNVFVKTVFTNELSMGSYNEPESKRQFVEGKHSDSGKEKVMGAAFSKTCHNDSLLLYEIIHPSRLS